MNRDKPKLHIDWATHKAARYACEHWHYSGCMPAGKSVKLGVWEDGKFIGVIVYGTGSGNCTNGKSYGLNRSHEMAELARVALCKHITPVSKMIAVTLKKIKKYCPNLRLIISLADTRQNHHGGIYQAGNWIYTGKSQDGYEYKTPDGRWRHHRSAGMRVKTLKGLPKRSIPGKHRYLMPLDKEMRQRIETLAKPYPRAPSADSGTSDNQSEGGGAIPTGALQNSE